MALNPTDFTLNHSVAETKYYTRIGDQDYLDDDGNPRVYVDNNLVYAKAVKDKRSKHFNGPENMAYSYYVKTDPNKNLYDPTNLHSIEPKIKKSFLNKVCKSELVFSQVSESVFNKYLNFLKTENSQWLTTAQRELK